MIDLLALLTAAFFAMNIGASGTAASMDAAYGGGAISRPMADRMEPRLKTVLSGFLIAAGFYEAVSAGMNNVANAIGPLVGPGVMTVRQGLPIGGLFVALGALTLGSRVLETNAKRITDLTPIGGVCVSFTSGSLVIAASLLGLPVPLTQATTTTTSTIGVGFARGGKRSLIGQTVRRVAQVWVLSPTISLVLAYGVSVPLLNGCSGSIGRTLAVMGLLGLSIAAAIYAGRKRFVAGQPRSAA